MKPTGADPGVSNHYPQSVSVMNCVPSFFIDQVFDVAALPTILVVAASADAQCCVVRLNLTATIGHLSSVDKRSYS